MDLVKPDSILKPKTCEVCEQALPFHQEACLNAECQSVISQKSLLSATAYNNLLLFERKLIQAKLEARELKQEHERHVTFLEDEESKAIAQQVIDSGDIENSENLHIVNLPTGPSQPVKLSEQRKLKFIKHLEHVIAQAREYKSIEDVPFDQHANARNLLSQNEALFSNKPSLEKTCDNLCATCKGGCCPEGADHAFVSAFTIREKLDSNPGLSDQDIIKQYTDYLTEEVMDGGCINQTATGCALPRNLRSDVCNSFFCEPLKQLQKNEASKIEEIAVIAVQRANHNWNRFEAKTRNPVTGTYYVNHKGIKALKR